MGWAGGEGKPRPNLRDACLFGNWDHDAFHQLVTVSGFPFGSRADCMSLRYILMDASGPKVFKKSVMGFSNGVQNTTVSVKAHLKKTAPMILS